MASNPFKAFVPYVMTVTQSNGKPANAFHVLNFDLENEAVPEYLHASDPTGGQWRCVGLTECHEGNFVHDLDGAGMLLKVQFNERILPGNVRDEHLTTLLASISEREGRKPSKKEYAQLRDQVEFELLPKSHIKRTSVYVLVSPEDNLVFAFTSSAKKADEAMTILGSLINETHTNSWMPYQVKSGMIEWMTALVRTSHDSQFQPTDAAVLKKAKETVRIKDKDLASHDVMQLLKGDEFDVHELAMVYQDGTDPLDSEPRLSFVLNDKLVFKRCVFPDMVMSNSTDKGEDGKVAFHSFAYLVAREYRTMLTDLTSELGGQVLQEPSKDSKTTPAATDEDDEL